jgi:tetratricopeptide (TPR) repeat protein
VGFRARKSIKLGPGVRLNVSHRGAGVRVGGRGGGVSVNTSGRRSASVGIPGSGVGYSKQWSKGGGQRSRAAAAPVAPPAPPKPGLLASGYEKAFHKAVNAYARGEAAEALRLFKESSARDTKDKALADDLFVGIIAAQTGEDATAIPALEKVVNSDQELPDELMAKYVPGGGASIPVTENVAVAVPFGSLAAALILAEVYQRNGRTEEAIGLMQQLVEVADDPFLVLSLCDLYAEVEAWDELVDMAAGTANEDDVSLQVRLYQARAFEAQGMRDAALEAYKDALKSKKRDEDLLKEARYARGRLYIEMGKKAQARKELERLYAEDPKFRDVADLIAATGEAASS